MRARWIGSWLAALCLLTAQPASAGSEGAKASAAPANSTYDLNYDLTILGLPLGNVRVHTNLNGSGYSAMSTLKTSGLVNLFWKSQIRAQSYGWLTNGALRPSNYSSWSINHRDKRQEVALIYRPEGPLLSANPPYKTDKYPVSDEQKKATLDPVSAMVFVTTGMSADAKNPCGSVARVFDGARRYDVALAYLKSVDVELDNDLYRGPVFLCQIHYRQIAGFKQKILQEGKKLPEMFAWVAQLTSQANPQRHYLVPVRLWAVTSYGTIAAQASRIKLDGTALKS